MHGNDNERRTCLCQCHTDCFHWNKRPSVRGCTAGSDIYRWDGVEEGGSYDSGSLFGLVHPTALVYRPFPGAKTQILAPAAALHPMDLPVVCEPGGAVSVSRPN